MIDFKFRYFINNDETIRIKVAFFKGEYQTLINQFTGEPRQEYLRIEKIKNAKYTFTINIQKILDQDRIKPPENFEYPVEYIPVKSLPSKEEIRKFLTLELDNLKINLSKQPILGQEYKNDNVIEKPLEPIPFPVKL